MRLLEGKPVAEAVYSSLHGRIASLQQKQIVPCFTIILVGDDPASQSYIRSKKRAAENLGIRCDLYQFSSSETTTESLLVLIKKLAEDPGVHGILVQLPLPQHIDSQQIIESIPPSKDVDGFAAPNLGTMFLGEEEKALLPCTPHGIIKLLEYYGIPVEGKNVTIVGRSNIVGKPLAVMLINRGATVTVCHSKTQSLTDHTKHADIVIMAVGKAGFLKGSMIKPNSIIIDVGINRNEERKIVGDVDAASISELASDLTPVPGGCGLTTVAALMMNVVTAAENFVTDKPNK